MSRADERSNKRKEVVEAVIIRQEPVHLVARIYIIPTRTLFDWVVYLFGVLVASILIYHYGVELVEGNVMKDHIRMLLIIPLKFSVANTIGFLKGESAIRIFRDYLQVKRNFTGHHFWARGYCVSTVGLYVEIIREYIKNQEREEKRHEQLKLYGL